MVESDLKKSPGFVHTKSLTRVSIKYIFYRVEHKQMTQLQFDGKFKSGLFFKANEEREREERACAID